MSETVKIVGIISSPNRNGNTATLVRQVLKSAEESGAETVEIFLSDYKLNFCCGCLQCTAKGKCPLPDKLEEIRKSVYAADGIVLGSPTYAMDYNAIMKNFFERLGPYTLYTSSLGGKYFVGISTSNGDYSKKTAKKLVGMAKMGIFKRSYVTGTLGTRIMVSGNSVCVSENPVAMRKAVKLGKKLTEDIRRNNTYPFQNLFMRLIVRLSLKPMFRSYILKNKGGKEKATYGNLSTRGLIP